MENTRPAPPPASPPPPPGVATCSALPPPLALPGVATGSAPSPSTMDWSAIEYCVALLLGAEVYANTADSGPMDMIVTLPRAPKEGGPPCLLAAWARFHRLHLPLQLELELEALCYY